MPDRVPLEAFVHGCWCELTEPGLETIEQALGVYTRVAHPELGDVWIVPAHYPLRGESKPAPALEIALPASFEAIR